MAARSYRRGAVIQLVRLLPDDEAIDVALDVAGARGAIHMSDRSAWRSRLRREPEMGRELLASRDSGESTSVAT